MPATLCSKCHGHCPYPFPQVCCLGCPLRVILVCQPDWVWNQANIHQTHRKEIFLIKLCKIERVSHPSIVDSHLPVTARQKGGVSKEKLWFSAICLHIPSHHAGKFVYSVCVFLCVHLPCPCYGHSPLTSEPNFFSLPSFIQTSGFPETLQFFNTSLRLLRSPASWTKHIPIGSQPPQCETSHH